MKVTPRQLRHTHATQLVNAGAKITTIQALLGHQRLNTTMTYARVHDQTVAQDYYEAMTLIEARLQPYAHPERLENDTSSLGQNGQATGLLKLVTALEAEPLTAYQQVLVAELHQRVTALTRPVNGTASQREQVVNEQMTQLPERLILP